MSENEIIKQSGSSVVPSQQNPVAIIGDNPISNIISDDQLQTFLSDLMGEFQVNKDEAMDMYFIFKDMITNSGDFDSSGVVKEQVSQLLKVAQDASTSKMRLFESIFRSKMKTQTINAQTVNQQNNTYIGSSRRELLKVLEEMEQSKHLKKTIDEDIIIEEVIEEEKDKEKEENIEPKNVNNEDEFEFEIKSGDL